MSQDWKKEGWADNWFMCVCANSAEIFKWLISARPFASIQKQQTVIGNKVYKIYILLAKKCHVNFIHDAFTYLLKFIFSRKATKFLSKSAKSDLTFRYLVKVNGRFLWICLAFLENWSSLKKRKPFVKYDINQKNPNSIVNKAITNPE